MTLDDLPINIQLLYHYIQKYFPKDSQTYSKFTSNWNTLCNSYGLFKDHLVYVGTNFQFNEIEYTIKNGNVVVLYIKHFTPVRGIESWYIGNHPSIEQYQELQDKAQYPLMLIL